MDISDQWLNGCAAELAVGRQQIRQTVTLLEEGGTVPFIARYRKEQTGSLDETVIIAIRDSLERFREVQKRRNSILVSLQERDLLDASLQQALERASTLAVLEDLYLPFRPKKQTRAAKARARGLEGLAKIILKGGNAEQEAASFVDEGKDVPSVADALAGARDIVAEQVSERSDVRSGFRRFFMEKSVVTSSVIAKMRDEAIKYKDYFDWQEPIKKLAGYRFLALQRGAEQKMLRVSFRPDAEEGTRILQSMFGLHPTVKGRSAKGTSTAAKNEQLQLALDDAYERLLAPSLENEVKRHLKEMADEEAIGVFGSNLKKLLLAPPLGRRRVMALDPGYRTGAKLVCLDEQGTLLCNQTIYPTHGGEQEKRAAQSVRQLVAQYQINVVAIGNGTAGRETESFVRSLEIPDLAITLVNEDGASIYSASELARSEFPDADITVRGAVSIGRRLQDPLAELVKIDPKSIGVGQYQHDVDQILLKKRLEEVVVQCVNHVGVELNSASEQLLCHVAGLGPSLAANIVQYRKENGAFQSRRQLRKVPRLGAKAFEQCAGFLRVRGGDNPLDNSAVHPERYALVERMATDCGVAVADLLASSQARQKIDIGRYEDESVGKETLQDILAELGMPGRDPRENYSLFSYDERVHSIDDLQVGMILPAVITNVTKFGAFADIGVKQDGLIHISQMADRFIKDPAEVVSVRDRVQVKVLEVDKDRKRIALSLKL